MCLCVCVCPLQYQSMRLSDVHRKAQLWRGIVSISLIEGRSLQPMDNNGLSDPYVKFRMGHQKYKSKVNTLLWPLCIYIYIHSLAPTINLHLINVYNYLQTFF